MTLMVKQILETSPSVMNIHQMSIIFPVVHDKEPVDEFSYTIYTNR